MKDNKTFKSVMKGLSESLEYTKGSTTKARRIKLIDVDELKKTAEYCELNSSSINQPSKTYIALEDIDNAPTIDLWHYPSKGELPIEGEEVLCKLPCNNYAVGKYNTQFEYFGFDDTNLTPINIECWQYIIPPKEKE